MVSVVVGLFLAQLAPASFQPSVPATPIAPEQRADIYMARKMYREAIDTYALVPSDSAVRWNKTGIAYHQLLDLQDAKKCYEHAVKLEPKYGEAWNNLGAIFYAQKSYRRSVKDYKHALKLMPESASVYSNLGTAYFAREDYKHASEAYQKALDLDPDVFDHHSTYGVLMQEHTVAERAKFHYYLAKMYARKGLKDQAIRYIRKSMEEGFTEKKKFLEEPEFADVRKTEEFQALMKSEPRAL